MNKMLMTKCLCYVSKTWTWAKHSPCKAVKTFTMRNNLMKKNLERRKHLLND